MLGGQPRATSEEQGRRCTGMKKNRVQKGGGRKLVDKTQRSGMLGREQENLNFLASALKLNIFLEFLTGSHMGLDITICLLRQKAGSGKWDVFFSPPPWFCAKDLDWLYKNHLSKVVNDLWCEQSQTNAGSKGGKCCAGFCTTQLSQKSPLSSGTQKEQNLLDTRRFSSFYWSPQQQDPFLNVLDNVCPFLLSVHPLMSHIPS